MQFAISNGITNTIRLYSLSIIIMQKHFAAQILKLEQFCFQQMFFMFKFATPSCN